MWHRSCLRLVLVGTVLTSFRYELVLSGDSGETTFLTSRELAEKSRSLLADANIDDIALAKHVAEKILEHALDGRAVSEVFKSGWEAQRHLTQLLLPNSSSEGVRLRLMNVLRTAGARDDEPWKEPDRSRRETNLKKHLLEDQHYDMHTPPTQTQVQLGLNLFKIYGIDLKQSVLHLATWFRLGWVDNRLAFNETLWNISFTTLGVEAHSFENSRIWVPDIEMYNMEESLQHLSDKYAILYPSGRILWSRPGLMKALCKFKGLNQFPFDILKCQMELGSWAYNDLVMDIIPYKLDGGITWIGEEGSGLGNGVVSSLTQGTSFQDYTLRDVLVERLVTYYDTVPGGWPVILYTITFRRARVFYVLSLVLPQLIVAGLSWITYFMHPEVGERFGFVITLFLASVAIDITAIEFMPVCAEMLLMNWISLVAMLGCVASLIETSLVMSVYRLEITDMQQLLPCCFRCKWFRSRFGSLTVLDDSLSEDLRRSSSGGSLNAVLPTSPSNGSDSCDTDAVQAVGRQGSGIQSQTSAMMKSTSDGSCLPHTVSGDSSRKSFLGSAMKATKSKVKGGLKEMVNAEFRASHGPGQEDADMGCKVDLRLRRHLYSQAFYILDEDFSGLLEFDEIDTFGKFMLGEDWSQEMLNHFLEAAETDGVAGLSLAEFSHFCETAVSHAHGDMVGSAQVQQMVTCFIEMMNREAEKNKNRWKLVALRIDHYCRLLIPCSMCFAYFVIILSLLVGSSK